MSNDLIAPWSRKAACAIVYLATSPVRLLFAALFTAVLPLFVVIAALFDLHSYGCNG